MTESKICTCPSGDGSLRWPCPAHPAVDQADVAAKLTFINGRPAMCGCQVEYSDGGGEYSDVIYVTLCAKHSGSAILDLVATNRIALTPEYEGQWHADLYLDREIPLAKVEGATPAEAVLALMSAERIDPEQESVEQASGDERAAFEAAASKLGIYTCNFQRYTEETAAHENRINARVEDPVRVGDYRSATLHDCWKIWQEARAALAQPSPVRSSLLINGYQLRAALDFIAPDGTAEQLESEACIEWRQQDADFLEAGLYAWAPSIPKKAASCWMRSLQIRNPPRRRPSRQRRSGRKCRQNGPRTSCVASSPKRSYSVPMSKPPWTTCCRCSPSTTASSGSCELRLFNFAKHSNGVRRIRQVSANYCAQ